VQTTFHYDYGQWRDAVKQAKKLRSQSVYVWVVLHPHTRRYKVLEGESIEDRPTRVPALWEHHSPPPKVREIDQRMMDRDNLKWLAYEIQNDGDTDNKLAQAILSYLETYDQ
jgi:hypothetical protein